MVVEAAAKFCCRHRYIATVDRGRALFECEMCHIRRELLPLGQTPPEAVRVIARSRSTWPTISFPDGDTA